MQNLRCSRGRAGFTLVELLVAIGIILFLAALAVRFLPTAYNSDREAGAAGTVQGWFDLAKQKALRDQAPRGVRLWVDPTTLLSTEAEFVEQPDRYTGDWLYSYSTLYGDVPNNQIVYFDPNPYNTPGAPSNVDIFNGQLVNSAVWLVQPGDSLQLSGGQTYLIPPLPHPQPVIMGDPPGKLFKRAKVILNTPMPFLIAGPGPGGTGASGTKNYAIVRQPRPIGDEKLQLPDGIAIDVSTNLVGSPFTNPFNGQPWNPLPLSPNGPYIDILFAPSGQVILPQLSTESINLWVRQPDPLAPNNYFAGTPSIIAIFVRTGFTAAFAPDPQWNVNLNNPYTDVK